MGAGKGRGGHGTRIRHTRTGQHNTHTETRQRRNEAMPWGDDGAGQVGAAPGGPLQPLPHPREVRRRKKAEGVTPHGSGCGPWAGWPLPEEHPVFLLFSRLGAALCPVGRRGRSTEPTPPHNQPWRAANDRMLGPGYGLDFFPCTPPGRLTPNPSSVFLGSRG